MFNNIRNYLNDSKWKINIFDNKINIVNYLDIITLEDTRISIKCNDCNIIVKGKNLTVNKLLDNEMLIIGTILSVEFE